MPPLWIWRNLMITRARVAAYGNLHILEFYHKNQSLGKCQYYRIYCTIGFYNCGVLEITIVEDKF